jgi:hypothetical protein
METLLPITTSVTGRLLVVLDFNGTLLDSTHRAHSGAVCDARARFKFVYFRPLMREFITWLIAQPDIDIGIWTSNTRENALALCDIVFPSDTERSRLSFVYSRDECVTFADYTSKKRAHRLFDLGYRVNQIIFVDDSPDKVEHPFKTTIHYQIPEFSGAKTYNKAADKELHVLREYISSRLTASLSQATLHL